ncbi:transient receptor potential ion channel family protein [Aspergillus saccharolyticus JOP 1030-1]|uniref:TRP-domain-containing protein n=1 Tax=Aspergillus saccharolyticus JOP 1030-1 TaxID=1450539 RepID=A0A318ZK70_9EURO|nr:TRP-domain-containing protein [Aspergillus saccharolyticus JOP 1030-1]PYH46774.1 TRP-domain-containing protein [Aspergillus saccharolyticus JOP 1030-1]
MRLSPILFGLFLVLLNTLQVTATRLIESSALNLCQASNNFTVTYFNVVFTPGNRSLAFSFDGVSAISGYVNAELQLTAYGINVLSKTMDPCEMGISGLCPMNTGAIDVAKATMTIPESVIKDIPGIAYTVPDLDASVRIYINSTETNSSITCMEAELSNGQTVYQKGVGWATAVISGLGLAASAITSGLGHSNTAAHVAANALSLFSFMQSQAMIGMTSVHMPPIVEAWTQNFQWSMGIIHVGFLEDICTWYQRATGGTAATLLSSLSTTSVAAYKRRKRSLEEQGVYRRASGYLNYMRKRASGNSKTATDATVIVRGIERVGFKAKIESTNIFMTGLIFFIVFVALVMILVVLFKLGCELLAKQGRMKSNKFQDFRNGWKVVARGILFRLTLIGFPQMAVLCLWELTQRDSAAEVVLAIVMFLSVVAALGWAALKVLRLASRSTVMHKNPAYILFSDPSCLNKWGFLYVQYRATAYYFILPYLGYIFVKGMFIGLSQQAPVVQTIALVIIEACMLIAVSVLRPWMDKKTNIYNITIAAINFLNVIFLLFFSEVFNQPGIVTGVMGVVFFVINAIFALVLLIMVLVASIYAIVSKNPDTRYQPMRDDRGSFIKSGSQLTTELDALGATARGDMKNSPYKSSPFEDDNASFSSGNGASVSRQNLEAPDPSPNHAARSPASPVDPSLPLFPSDNRNGSHDANFGRSPSPVPRYDTASPMQNPHAYRQQNNPSPWQRGAGYDH